MDISSRERLYIDDFCRDLGDEVKKLCGQEACSCYELFERFILPDLFGCEKGSRVRCSEEESRTPAYLLGLTQTRLVKKGLYHISLTEKGEQFLEEHKKAVAINSFG